MDRKNWSKQCFLVPNSNEYIIKRAVSLMTIRVATLVAKGLLINHNELFQSPLVLRNFFESKFVKDVKSDFCLKERVKQVEWHLNWSAAMNCQMPINHSPCPYFSPYYKQQSSKQPSTGYTKTELLDLFRLFFLINLLHKRSNVEVLLKPWFPS